MTDFATTTADIYPTLDELPTDLPKRPRYQFRFKTLQDLDAEPYMEWLVEGVLPVRAFGLLYGKEATYKSFCALDLALSIASGRDWQGHPAKPGSVLYISGEGNDGLKKRINAWRKDRNPDYEPQFKYLDYAVVMTDPDVADSLVSMIKLQFDSPPALIVIDPLARCFGDGNENETQDMNRFVYSVERLRETGAAVLVIHHEPKGGGSPRGNTALAAALNTSFHVKRNDAAGIAQVTLTCKKQKDGAQDLTITLASRTIELDDGKTSEVLDRKGGDSAGNKSDALEEQKRQDQVVAKLREHGPLIWVDLREALRHFNNLWGEKKLRDSIDHLEARGIVNHVKMKGRGGKYKYYLSGEHPAPDPYAG